MHFKTDLIYKIFRMTEEFILRFSCWSYCNDLAMWERGDCGVDLANDKVCNWKSKVIRDKTKNIEYNATEIYFATGYIVIAAMSEGAWSKIYSQKIIYLENIGIQMPSEN